MTETDLCAALAELGGRSFTKEIARWVHGTADLPLKTLLERQGVAIRDEPAQIAQRLGVRVADGTGIQVKNVLRASAAERAGFAAGDEWFGVEVGAAKSASSWRLTKLDDLLLYAGSATKIGALIARDKRLLKLSVTLPKSATTWRLAARDNSLVGQWLDAP